MANLIEKLFFGAWILIASTSTAVAAQKGHCKYEENCECSSPGITLRWELLFCAFKTGADMETEQEAIDKCRRESQPRDYSKLSSCRKNEFWRKKHCELYIKQFGGTLKECLATVPNFIERGIGGN